MGLAEKKQSIKEFTRENLSEENGMDIENCNMGTRQSSTEFSKTDLYLR